MRRLLIPAALGAAALVPSTASAAFTHGVASAEVTSSSALVWAHPTKTGAVQLVIATDRRFRKGRITRKLKAARANDLTVQTRVAKLKPGKRYFYFFIQGRSRSAIGTFATAPAPSAARTIRFAVTGDTSGEKDPNGILYFNRYGSKNFATFRQMAKEKNDFNVNLGDTIYSDRLQQGPGRLALSLADKRKRYQEVLGFKNLTALRASGPVYNQWDDHEFIDDFTPRSEACDVGSAFSAQYPCDNVALRAAGVKAFREYMPVTYSPASGTYRTFRWGKNLEVFILDERSFRSIKASEVKVDPSKPEPTNHVCEAPQGTFDQDDPAPQVPQRIRDNFSFIYPPAINPVPQMCLDALNDPKRTMLGSAQYNAFTKAVKASKAKWKIVINEVPIMAQYLNPYDSWQGYEAERKKLLTYLRDNVKNVAFMTTDFHTNWVSDARLSTFPEDGGEVKSGIMDFIAGGVSDHLFGAEIDEFAQRADSYKALDGAFMRNAPPNGVGFQCSNMVTFGYLQVTAKAGTLKVELKDNQGKQISNSNDGSACGPYVLNAK
jgi:phosphodiesterase/alkaline phosphatase D-like protein